MSSKKIKVASATKKVRGYRQQQAVQANERHKAQRILQEQNRRRRLTNKDGDTGEEYMLARLAIRNKEKVEEYRDGLAAVVDSIAQEGIEQAEAVRVYLQAWVAEKQLVPIVCGPGEKPTCRVYSGANRRVVVLRQDEPEAGIAT